MDDLERFPVKSERTGNLGTDEGGKNEGQKLECVSLSFVDPFSKEKKNFTI